MIYVTGDTHGRFERIARFCRAYNPTINDILIILGDAGINYFKDYRDERIKEVLSALPLTMFFIHGNHERRPASISSYVTKEWNGGTVYYEPAYPNLLFAKDGEVFDFEGTKTLVIGGAYSVDKYYRLSRGMHWFSDEQPSEEIKQYVMEQIGKHNGCFDCILSHTCPYKYIPTEAFLPGVDQSTVDNSTELWLDEVREKTHYNKWYCGHYHINKKDRKLEFLFDTIKAFR